MPVTEFEQPASRIGGGGGRGRAGLAVWVVGLAGIVVVGAGGRLAGEADGEATPVAAASPGSAPSAGTPEDDVLVLTDPTTEVTTVAVRIRGRAADAVDRVELVLLQANAALGRQVVRPTGSGLFAGLFTLGRPRSAANLTVVAIGRDRDGARVAHVSRDILLGALRAAAAEPGPVPRLGEDGAIGSRGVDLGAFEPWLPPPYAPVAEWSYPIGELGWQANPVQR